MERISGSNYTQNFFGGVGAVSIITNIKGTFPKIYMFHVCLLCLVMCFCFDGYFSACVVGEVAFYRQDDLSATFFSLNISDNFV